MTESTEGIRKSNRRWQSDVIVDLVKRYGFPYVALNPVQFVGRPFTEAMLYRFAQFYEDATCWTKHHPAGLAD